MHGACHNLSQMYETKTLPPIEAAGIFLPMILNTDIGGLYGDGRAVGSEPAVGHHG